MKKISVNNPVTKKIIEKLSMNKLTQEKIIKNNIIISHQYHE